MAQYDKWTVKALKEYCKEHNIKIPSSSKKTDIITLLESTPEQLNKEQTLTNKRQEIIKKVLEVCKKEGEEKIINFFERRGEDQRLKQVFIVYKINFDNPSHNDIRNCLKYFQETQNYNNDEKLLINQMIAQPLYIDPTFVDEREKDFEDMKKYLEFRSATGIVPTSKVEKGKSLNKITELDK